MHAAQRATGKTRDVATESGQPDHRQIEETQAGFARMAVWLLRTQAVLVVVGAVIAVVLSGTAAGLAFLAGGGIGILLTAVAALRTGVVSAQAGVATMVAAFYRAMAMKLVIAVALFCAVAYWFADYFGPVLAGYVVTVVAYWLAMWRLGRSGPKTNPQDD